MSDSDSDSSSSSSSSLPSKITAIKTKSSSSKATSNAQDDPTWAYAPPEGMSLISDSDIEDNGEEWDWDSFQKDSELELLVIRAPSGVKPKHLENLTIDLSNSSSSKNHKVGVLNRKHESYDVWNLGGASSSSSNVGGVEVGRMDDEASSIGGEEMKGLTCLLPRKKKNSKRGEFYIAPRPISRHIIVTAQPPKPSTEKDSPETSSIPTQNPPRFAYPPELLSHRFIAFGSTNAAVADADNDEMDLDVDPPTKKKDGKELKETSTKTSSKSKESKETKKRKKNADTEEPEMPSQKKQKKSKSKK
ncbi:hypothetical protein BT96DRAFT_915820 [Gymnopus androsaceus JB14]|uniref:Uncharacterized protein n=1 Tax=Gymnopus androsaceus JB14 TaxID=1447944 RepID=A0A6A4I5R2_9AGAR|nr:hypothetical protein BT96DRAFT_915820 [Gymnopus androsaceus JB14]